MRWLRSTSAALALAASSLGVAGAAGAAPSPYPASLTMRHGLTFSTTGRALRWGTALTTAQARWVTIESSGGADRWGVWRRAGGPAQYPVRSADGGLRWVAAGPQLSSDWAGGSLFEVTVVIGEGPLSAVMVSHSIIDVTTDGGRQWYQYLHATANWSISRYRVRGGGIGLRVAPASFARLPRGSYALYVLDVVGHRWRRVAQSLR